MSGSHHNFPRTNNNRRRDCSNDDEYDSHKPKWWKKLSGRKATKGQRRIINEMKLLGYVIHKPKQQKHDLTHTYLDWDDVFMNYHRHQLPNNNNMYDDDDDTNNKNNTNTVTDFNNDHIITEPPHHQQVGCVTNHDYDNNDPCTLSNDDIHQRNHEKKKEYWIELGFGKGDNLLCLVHQTFLKCYQQRQQQIETKEHDKSHHDDSMVESYFIGAEIHPSGVGNIVSKMYQCGIQQQRYWTEYQLYHGEQRDDKIDNNVAVENENDAVVTLFDKQRSVPKRHDLIVTQNHHHHHLPQQHHQQDHQDQPYSNVRIYYGDGVKLLSHIVSSTIHHIVITFPDPFPTDIKYRMMQISTLRDMYRILVKPNANGEGGGRVYVATDHVGYYEWVVTEQIPKMNAILLDQDEKKYQGRDEVSNDVNIHHHVMDSSTCDLRANHLSPSCHNVMATMTKRAHLPLFHQLDPCPNRIDWLPAISKYEAKGHAEGRMTYLACWEIR